MYSDRLPPITIDVQLTLKGNYVRVPESHRRASARPHIYAHIILTEGGSE